MSSLLDLVLPDGTVRKVPVGTTTADVAKGIGPGLAKAAVAGVLDGQVYDLHRALPHGGSFRILRRQDKESLEVLRHSAAHLLAMAVLDLHPGTDLGFGPATEDGFYYDFRPAQPFQEADLPRIEARMREIAREARPYARTECGKDAAKARLQRVGYALKLPHVDEIPEEAISFYDSGGFTDMCEGPHVPDTSWIGAVKLLSVSGTHWRGDVNGVPMQRIRGTAFFTQEDLDAHLKRVEEAKLRDHRRIGREMDLFSFHEEAPGAVFWHPKGMVLWNTLTEFVRTELRRRGYGEVGTPMVLSDELWKKSGHWDHYKDNMYFMEVDERSYAVRPMNCPGCCLVFGTTPKSYKELPMRLAEFGRVYRHELSGVLHGAMRVRTFTQDDAHIFCDVEQMQDEIADMIDMWKVVYRALGYDLAGVAVKVATRPKDRMGAEANWDRAERALMDALRSQGLAFGIAAGEGAFYGPKIEFHVTDCIGRTWQCGTVQVDFSMPERFGLEFTGKDGNRHTPVMLHRAILGSMERQVAVLIEHHAGKFPLWLAPVQARVLPITEAQNDYATRVAATLAEAGLRVETDLGSDKVGSKIRQATLERIPFMLVVGAREAEAGAVSVRERTGQDHGVMPVAGFLDKARARIAERT
ncbi:MAG: threonine--tRNA ligase [Planctomycetes bacterium]|nr:threonine--tRNA ligase [Planctomycetota bacterium]